MGDARPGSVQTPALIERHVPLDSPPFFSVEYLRVDDPPEWTAMRGEAGVWDYMEASKRAGKLSTREIHVFAAVARPATAIAQSYPPRERHRAQVLPGEDWRARAVNCGVE